MSTVTTESLADETYKTLACRLGVIFAFSCSIQCQDWRENHDLKYDTTQGIILNDNKEFSHSLDFDILELVEKLQNLGDKRDVCFDMPMKNGEILGWHDFTYTDKGKISVKVTAILSPPTFIRDDEGEEVSARQSDDLERYGFALVFTDDGWIQMLARHLPRIYTGKLAYFKAFETIAQVIVMSTTSTVREDQRVYAQMTEAFELLLKDVINAGHAFDRSFFTVASAFSCWGKEVVLKTQTQSVAGRLVRLDVNEQAKTLVAHIWEGHTTLMVNYPMDFFPSQEL